ncbi:hypothetical protein [Streptosporangium sp. NPDC002524]|uniref:hypothetical protein n=1 Tax=Streptosporangium sp. NPDC002524 TaxID=3154537 RepID=UPI0033224F1B
MRQVLVPDAGTEWRSGESTFAETSPSPSLPEPVRGYVATTVRDRDLARILIWDGPQDGGEGDSALPKDMRGDVEDMRRRQAEGEFPADLDPACLLPALFSAADAGVTFPRPARAICGEDPASEEFGERYGEQPARLLRHVGAAKS